MICAYACINNSISERMNSSSGGIFSLLVDYSLEKNGIIYGVVMSDDCYNAKFLRATTKEQTYAMMGSKYLQAKVGDTFTKVKKDLLDGKFVLFTGTGCQIIGLKRYLNKDYDNLLCVDFICHGVPSNHFWKKYVFSWEKEHGQKMMSVNFRCKQNGWTNYGVKENAQFVPRDDHFYMQMFLADYCLRPSCYNCIAKKDKFSDMTLGDFWGISEIKSTFSDDKGVSVVIIRTYRAKVVFDYISKKMHVEKVSYKDAVKMNSAEYKSAYQPVVRKGFYIDLEKYDFTEFKMKYLRVLRFRNMKSIIKARLRNILK